MDIKDMIKKDNRWVIGSKIPRKQKNSKKIRTASYDVAKTILEDIKSKYLKMYLSA